MQTFQSAEDCKYCAVLRESLKKDNMEKAKILLLLEAHNQASHDTLSKIFLEKVYSIESSVEKEEESVGGRRRRSQNCESKKDQEERCKPLTVSALT
jgi:hypothetical protein